MVFCTYCGQSFTRDEHLERHILTHTNVKPFKCFTCHMSFARRDLLQRHYTVHGRDQNHNPIPAANGMIPKSAGRTPIACSNCAKTKTKCDKKFPCSRCANRNLKCTLRPNRRSTKTMQRPAVSPEAADHAPSQDGTLAVEGGNAVTAHATTSPPSRSAAKPLTPTQSIQDSPDHKESEVSNMQTTQSQRTYQQDSPPMSTTSRDPPSQVPSSHAGDAALTHAIPPASTMLPVALNGYLQDVPRPGFDTVSHGQYQEVGSSPTPRFLLDWTQLQIPGDYDGMLSDRLLMEPDLSFESSGMQLDSTNEVMMPILPDITAPLATPTETPPRYYRSFSHDLDLGMSAAAYQQTTHITLASMIDARGDVEIISSARDAWSRFCCNPVTPASTCLKTARVHLDMLVYTLKDPDVWSNWSPRWAEDEIGERDHLTVMQLHESTRDKLLALTQGVLARALETHRENGLHQAQPYVPHGQYPSSFISRFSFVLLPPLRVLECLLRSYANGFERFYPLIPWSCLDANELIHCHDAHAASLLLLLMFAYGANSIPSRETRMLSGGLTEACRVSLLGMLDGGMTTATDPLILHAALLFVVQAIWSGDKWQMDAAIAQRCMYTTMLRNSGVLTSHQGTANVRTEEPMTTEQLRDDWMFNESRSRLIYSWVMTDQEISLLHDTAPLFSVSELGVPMPDADRLWHAKDAAEWSGVFELVHEFSGGYSSLGSGVRPMSLLQLFRHFLNEEMIPLGIETTPLQLRLLLHPIQSLVYQHSQALNCLSDAVADADSPHRVATAASTKARLGEAQFLLRQWYDLAERYLKANPLCPVMQANLVIFHLISLNAVTDFAETERLARRENFDGSLKQLLWKHKRCIRDVEEAIYHCGQVLRLVRAMRRSIRPPWWAAAIYRVAVIMWVESLLQKEHVGPSANGMFSVPGPSFAIDALSADHPLIVRYLTKREGAPCVTKRDGSQMSIDDGVHVLMHCAELIDEGAASRFSDGIRAKLERLART